MSPEWRKRIQITLIVFFVAAVIRLGMIYFERKSAGEAGKPKQPLSSYKVTQDDYVTLPKVFPYDIKSAGKELDEKTVWVRNGNQVPYFAYAGGHADLNHKAGLLPPLAKLTIRNVVLQAHQPLAIFTFPEAPGSFATAIGTEQGGAYTFYINDAFFLADPHTLYSHWPTDIWEAIDHHQAKPGMNELQVGLALGTGGNIGSGEYGNRTIEYANGGHPVTVTFENNKATEIVEGKKQ